MVLRKELILLGNEEWKFTNLRVKKLSVEKGVSHSFIELKEIKKGHLNQCFLWFS